MTELILYMIASIVIVCSLFVLISRLQIVHKRTCLLGIFALPFVPYIWVYANSAILGIQINNDRLMSEVNRITFGENIIKYRCLWQTYNTAYVYVVISCHQKDRFQSGILIYLRKDPLHIDSSIEAEGVIVWSECGGRIYGNIFPPYLDKEHNHF